MKRTAVGGWRLAVGSAPSGARRTVDTTASGSSLYPHRSHDSRAPRAFRLTANRQPLTASASGFSLVELVISITIVGIAAAAVLGVLSLLSTGSAEALVRYQAVAIGNAYLEEALLKPFVDPDGVDGESVRASFDDVNDYHGVDDAGARDQFGAALNGLDQYRVTISVQNGTLGSIASSNALRIDVTVRHPAGVAMTFSGYRTRY